ncbi:MAG: hypothetical protein ACI9OJ_001747, partial [Myxococcota bacterium]
MRRLLLTLAYSPPTQADRLPSLPFEFRPIWVERPYRRDWLRRRHGDVEPTLPVRTATQLVLDGETEVHVVGAPVTYLLSNVDGFDQGFSLQADHTGPTHFSFDVAITPLSALVQGRTVVLTTSKHPPEVAATVTVASAVTDIVSVDTTANTATFATWESPAALRITELNSSIVNGDSGYCGLIELGAVSPGTPRDLVVRSHF